MANIKEHLWEKCCQKNRKHHPERNSFERSETKENSNKTNTDK